MKKIQSKRTILYSAAAIALVSLLMGLVYLSLTYRIQAGEEAIYEQLHRQSIEIERLEQTLNTN